ncbi:CDC48 family AAA ATPase [Candidatus Nitrosotalea okcheonensis]|uniref:Cell division protein 48 (CDC48), domain 2 n=1 Tax=Candidatus Nitrosotalea okcheonensis TaxID=1903276 RepID=A0A2H1FIR7_9ARCH
MQISLPVQKAYSTDIGRGFARLSFEAMDELHVTTGDMIEIGGKKKTVAKCLPLRVSDANLNILRVDSTSRKNMDVGIGDSVTIQSINLVNANTVVVSPVKQIPSGTEQYLKDCLEEQPIMKGNVIILPFFNEKLVYKIISVKPIDLGVVTKDTCFEIIM